MYCAANKKAVTKKVNCCVFYNADWVLNPVSVTIDKANNFIKKGKSCIKIYNQIVAISHIVP